MRKSKREETMDLTEAVALVMKVKNCTAQEAIDELLEAWRTGELSILAEQMKKAEQLH